LAWGVAFNFLTADVDQGFLLPPDVREWLDPGHLVYTVMDAVAQFDLSGFRVRYREDGRGGAAYDPQLMVGLLLFAYCEGIRSSREIERRCQRDVAYRVLSGNRRPDHATIARFRDRHSSALQGVFVQVLRLCAEAGLVRVGLVAVDGTKLRANAASGRNYDRTRLDKAIKHVSDEIAHMLAEASRQDAAEDAAEASQDDDDQPPELRNRQQRLAKLQAAKARLDAEAAERQRMQDQRRAEWEALRAARKRRGPEPGKHPPERGRGNGKTNLTDPDSRIMHTAQGYQQSYNAQAVATSDQIVVAAEVNETTVDYRAFHPMLDKTRDNLDAAGVSDQIRAVVADAGYSAKTNRDQVRPANNDPIPLVAVPTLGGRRTANSPTGQDPRFLKDRSLLAMAKRVENPAGARLYARRKSIIEPVFGQLKQRGGPQLHHRGLHAVSTEWKMMTAAHNLLKYWRRLAAAPAI
jgi:transposase